MLQHLNSEVICDIFRFFTSEIYTNLKIVNKLLVKNTIERVIVV